MANTTRDSIGSSFLDSSFGKKVSTSIVDKSGTKSCCPSLTLKQRVIGYGICTGLGKLYFYIPIICILISFNKCIGFIISLLSFGILFSVITGNVTRFAIPYTFGTILSFCG